MITKIKSPSYDHRWFIWTIVFLIVSGVSLTSYIMITEIDENTMSYETVWAIPHK